MYKSQRFGHWVWIVEHACTTCGVIAHIVAGDTRRAPSLPPGAIKCACGGLVPLG